MKINRFGDRLQRARENKKLTQEQLSKLLGISQQRYSPWEAGKKGKQIEPPYDMLSSISEILEVGIEWLVRGSIKQAEYDQKIMMIKAQFEKYGYDSFDTVMRVIKNYSEEKPMTTQPPSFLSKQLRQRQSELKSKTTKRKKKIA